MAAESVKLKFSSETDKLSDVPLVQGDEKKDQEHGTVLVNNSTLVKTEEINVTQDNTKETINKIQVKYSLNKVKNLDVAKVNASRPIKIERLTSNDTNIRYEMNSGQYLHIKEEMRKYKKGETETTVNGEVTFKVEKNSAVEDVDENNPETQIKMLVTNNKTEENTTVVIKLYHSNQSIHLQGGRSMGLHLFNGRPPGGTLEEEHGRK